MMWYPNCVLIGPRISPGSMAKAWASNSGTIWPRENGGSWPPFVFPLGSSVFSLASFAKSAPLILARAAMFSAFALATSSAFGPPSGLTAMRMCATLICSGTVNVSFRFSYSAAMSASVGFVFARILALSTRRYLRRRWTGVR